MNVQQILFHDAMDRTRFLRIKEEKQNTVVAKVFFGPNKNNLTYHGQVELSKRLFSLAGGSRIGFNPYTDPPPPRPVREFRRYEQEDRY